jgi:hypothetical protein
MKLLNFFSDNQVSADVKALILKDCPKLAYLLMYMTAYKDAYSIRPIENVEDYTIFLSPTDRMAVMDKNTDKLISFPELL